jgi:hypothetical protein
MNLWADRRKSTSAVQQDREKGQIIRPPALDFSEWKKSSNFVDLFKEKRRFRQF